MRRILTKKTLFISIIVLVVVAALGTAGFFYKQYESIKKNPNIVAQNETKEVVNAISKFMILPSGEDPTMATVTDKDKLKDQDFFKNSQNGDKILIYTKAKKAILYRPSTGKVVEFAPLLIGDSGSGDSAAGQSTANGVKVAIYNGSQTANLASDTEKKIAGVNGITVVSKANAAKNTYTQSQVIDISGTNGTLASQIAKTIGGIVISSMPDGEAKPDADILVIAGK